MYTALSQLHTETICPWCFTILHSVNGQVYLFSRDFCVQLSDRIYWEVRWPKWMVSTTRNLVKLSSVTPHLSNFFDGMLLKLHQFCTYLIYCADWQTKGYSSHLNTQPNHLRCCIYSSIGKTTEGGDFRAGRFTTSYMQMVKNQILPAAQRNKSHWSNLMLLAELWTTRWRASGKKFYLIVCWPCSASHPYTYWLATRIPDSTCKNCFFYM